MISSGLNVRNVNRVFIYNKNHGEEKGKILEHLATGKTGDKANTIKSIVPEEGEIFFNIPGNAVDRKIMSEIKKLDTQVEFAMQLRSLVSRVHNTYAWLKNQWVDKIDLNTGRPTEDAKDPNNWIDYNNQVGRYIDDLKDAISDEIYTTFFMTTGYQYEGGSVRGTRHTISFNSIINQSDKTFDSNLIRLKFDTLNSGTDYIDIPFASFENIFAGRGNTYVYVENVVPGSDFQKTDNDSNDAATDGSMRYTFEVIVFVESKYHEALEALDRVKNQLDDKKNELLKVNFAVENGNFMVYVPRSINSVIFDKEQSKQKIDYYTGMMETIYSAIELMEDNVIKLRDTITKIADGEVDVVDPKNREHAKMDIKSIISSINNIISNASFDNESNLIMREMVELSDIFENKKLYLYQSNDSLSEFLNRSEQSLEGNKYLTLTGKTLVDAGMYSKQSMLDIADMVLDDINRNKTNVFSMMKKLSMYDYLNDLAINNMQYIVNDVENIDIQEETMDLMQIEVLESVSSEAVVKVKDSAKVLMRLIQG